MAIRWLMARDTAPTSYVTDLDPRWHILPFFSFSFSSEALFRGVPLEDIYMAAGWSSPHTFVRFYNLDVNTAPGSQVLSV